MISKVFGIVYITTCLVNGKVYIGQTIHWQVKSYLGSGVALCEAVKKYGRKKFKRKILKVCYNQKQLDAWEMIMIRKYNSTDKSIGYNVLSGTANEFGCGSPAKLPEVREKLRKKQLGKKLSEETRKKISLGNKGKTSPMKGKKLSDETRLKMKLAHIGKHTGANNGMYGGKHHTEEWRKKHSEVMKGRKHTEETKAKMRHPHKIRK